MKLLVKISIVVTFVFFSCASLTHVHKDRLTSPDMIRLARLALKTIVVKAVVRYPGVEKSSYEFMKAVGFVISGNRFVALTHATEVKNYLVIKTMMGPRYRMRQVISVEYLVDEEEVDLIGKHEDISLFALSKSAGTILSFCDSNDVIEGAKVLLAGFPYNFAYHVSVGMVSETASAAFSVKHKMDAANSFMVSGSGNPGDSGGIAICIMDGEPRIIGVIHAILGNGIVAVFKSNYVKDSIEKIMLST